MVFARNAFKCVSMNLANCKYYSISKVHMIFRSSKFFSKNKKGIVCSLFIVVSEIRISLHLEV